MPSIPSLRPAGDGPAVKRQAVRRSVLVRAARLLLVASLAGCAAEPARPPAPSGPPRSVQLAQATLTTLPVTTEVVGTVRAIRSASVAPLLNGTVSEVRIGLGTQVRAGDVLLRLSAREVVARLEQAHAVYALARREEERATALLAGDVIPRAQYDAARSQLTVAEAKKAEASSIAEHAVLRAPFSGVITVKRVNVGDTVLAGQPLLVLEAPGALRFEARVPEAAGERLPIGSVLPVRIDGLEQEIEGRITEIEPGSDELTRTQLLKLDLPPVPQLRSGRFGRLLLVSGESVSVTVPAQALVRRGQLELVFVEEAGSARLRLVRTGRRHAELLAIAAGLSGGERVVVSRAAELVDGQRVEAAK
jgi:membrane fusion protein, multidrug efflux system